MTELNFLYFFCSTGENSMFLLSSIVDAKNWSCCLVTSEFALSDAHSVLQEDFMESEYRHWGSPTKLNSCCNGTNQSESMCTTIYFVVSGLPKVDFLFFLLEIIITNATKHNMGHIWLNRPAVSVTFYIIYQFMAVYIGNKCQSVPVLDFLSL